MTNSFSSLLLFSLSLCLLAACVPAGEPPEESATTDEPEAHDTSAYPVLSEAFHTERDENDNVDSPAVWHGPDGQHWLLATAKEGHSINVYDATNGDFIRKFGQEGEGPGTFKRPNGIWVIDDLLLVVERDNARVQVLRLPDFSVVGMMTHEDLRYPYGLSVHQGEAEQQYEVFVTDNFNPALEGYPPEEELDERIHHYRFSYQSGSDDFSYETVALFGDISGAGVLHKVESLHADTRYDRLLIADEAFSQRNVKIYDLAGNFTGEHLPDTYFSSEPEGIALYACEDGSGYWIAADQHKTDENKYEVFDRESLEHLGGFKAAITRNTDGIWLTQRSFGDFERGAFYPVHDDGSITAISWGAIADALGLERDCRM